MGEDNLGRRKHLRVKAPFLVCFRAKFSETVYSRYQYALIKDISAGGLLVMSDEIFPQGTEIELIITLPMYPDKKISARGEAATHKNRTEIKNLFPLRIKFIDFDAQAFEKLTGYIAGRSQENGERSNPSADKPDRRKNRRDNPEPKG